METYGYEKKKKDDLITKKGISHHYEIKPE